jgi:PKD repeat protein
MPRQKGYKYKWYNGDTTNSITAKHFGKYWVVLDSQSCIVDTFNVQDNLSSKASFLFGISGDSLTVVNTSSNYRHIKWLFGDGDSSFAIVPKHTYSKPGLYKLQLIAYGPCNTDTLSQYVYMLTGLHDIEQATAFNIYPNPAGANLTIMMATSTVAEYATITDVAGRTVFATKLSAANGLSNSYVLDISKLSAGIYFLKLNINHQIETLKFVKQ